jgi:nucleoside-diphosphate-sugar epimerase
LVTGAAGFVGHHLVRHLASLGYWIRAVDLQAPVFEATKAHEFLLLDLRRWEACQLAMEGIGEVYHLAADMGGIGYISAYHAEIARNNVLMNTHVLEAARLAGVRRFFFASSACIYPRYRQNTPDVTPLKEDDAYPADPEEGYGWEKLFTEKLCQYYSEDFGMHMRVARFHNVYGPLGTYDGGKEKAPAAICRKVALAQDGAAIEVWGDGKQTRSFIYVDDCVQGICRLMRSGYRQPLNLGTDRLVTVDELVDLVCQIAGKRLQRRYRPDRPQGVRGRNSDNTRLQRALRWTPQVSLETGLARTYWWIEAELRRAGRLPKSSTEALTAAG